MNSDFVELLQLLEKYKAEYMIVGGYAVIEYCEPRYTKDIDIWTKASPSNASRVFKALEEFGAPISTLTEKDFSKEGFFFAMGRAPSRIDILMSIPGVNFDNAWENKSSITLCGQKFNLISIDDLITNKLSSGRPQDLIDADNLKKSKNHKKTF